MRGPWNLGVICALVAAVAVVAAFSGCGGQSASGQDHLSGARSDAPLFTFAVIGDPHIGAHVAQYYMLDGVIAEKLLTNAVNDINARGVDFTVVIGDLSHSGLLAEFQTAKGILDHLSSPYVPLVGNHDNVQADNFAAFKQVFGATTLNYSWDYKGFHFITASSESPTHTEHPAWTDDTIAWVRSDLQANSSKPTIFLTHHNFFDYMTLWAHAAPTNAALMRQCLEQAGNVVMTISGHAHRFRYKYTTIGYATIGAPVVYPAKIVYYHVYADRVVSEPVVLSQAELVRSVTRLSNYPYLRRELTGKPSDQLYVVPVNTPPASSARSAAR